MDKTYESEMRRTFLLESLPEPLTGASRHLQIFDNYIAKTRMRLRFVRTPETKKQTWVLEQRFLPNENDLSIWKTSQIYLNETEHKVFEKFEGREIRKNRYFLEFEEKEFEIDVYLGELRGLNIANVYFENEAEIKNFQTPEFAIFEITNYKFFTGEILVEKNFEDVREEFEKINRKNK